VCGVIGCRYEGRSAQAGSSQTEHTTIKKRFQRAVSESFNYCLEMLKEGAQRLSILRTTTYSVAHLRHVSKTTVKQIAAQRSITCSMYAK